MIGAIVSKQNLAFVFFFNFFSLLWATDLLNIMQPFMKQFLSVFRLKKKQPAAATK